MNLKITFRSLSVVCAVYLMFGGLFGRLIIFPQSDVLSSIISLPSILLAPFLVGLFILTISRLALKLYSTLGLIAEFSVCWGLGTVVLVAAVMITQYFNIFSVNLLFLVIGTASLYNILKADNHRRIIFFKNKTKLVNLLIIVIFSLVPVCIASMSKPYPLFGLEHDAPAYIWQPVFRAIESNYFTVNVQTGDAFFTLLACSLFNIEPASFLWFARFLLEAMFSIGVYLFIKALGKSDTFALIVAVIAPYLMVGTQGNSTFMLFFDVPLQDFRSNTILYSLFPYALYIVEKKRKSSQKNLGKTARMLFLPVTFTAALLLYYSFPENLFGFPPFFKPMVINPIVISILSVSLAYLLLSKFRRKEDDFVVTLLFMTFIFSLMHESEFILFSGSLFVYLLIRAYARTRNNIILTLRSLRLKLNAYSTLKVVSLAALFFAFLVNLLIVPRLDQIVFNTPLLFFYQNFDVKSFEMVKFPEFIIGNGFAIVPLLVCGILFLLFKSRRKDLSIMLMFSTLILLFFVPFGWNYRLYKEIVPFMAFIMAIPLYKAVNLISKIKKTKAFKVFALSLMFLALFSGLIYPVWQRYSYTDSTIPEKGWQSYLSYSEVETANFLRSNVPENSLIISDPFTIWTLTAMSNKIWPVEKWMTIGDLEVYHHMKEKIFLASSSESAYHNSVDVDQFIPFGEMDFVNKVGIHNFSILIVLSCRTSSWIKHEDYPWFVNFPEGMSVEEDYLQQFMDKKYFDPLFSLEEKIYVFEAKVQVSN